jgi:hypothetical protein
VLAGAPGTGALDADPGAAGADPGALGAAAAPPPLVGPLAPPLVVDALAVSALLGPPPAAAASDGSTAGDSLSPAGAPAVLDDFVALPEHPATRTTTTALHTHLIAWL